MAERRMFAKSIVLSDAFLDMPLSARCLYFTLGMLADDDGFIGNPKSIMRQCGATNDDMQILLAKRYVLGFESGIIVIKHWRMNNFLRNDRYHETTYLEEKNSLEIDEKGAYTETNKHGIPLGNQMDTQVRLGKDRLGKFNKPTLEEVQVYCKERNNTIDPQAFLDYYDSVGWKVGNKPMKDWKACVRTWEQRRKDKTIDKGGNVSGDYYKMDF